MSKYFNEEAGLDKIMMSSAQFEEGTKKYARTLSRDHNMRITFAGDGACTRPNEMILPHNDADMTKRQVQVGEGFCDHETLHQQLTDMEGAAPRINKLLSEGKKLAAAAANAIEDVRIENGGKTLYAGMPKHINRTAEYVNKCFLEEVYEQDKSIVDTFQQIGPVAITWEGRRRLGYESESNVACLNTLPADIRSKVEKMVDIIMAVPTGAKGAGVVDWDEAVSGTHQAIDLAERFAKEMEEEDDRRPPPPPGGGGICDDGEGDPEDSDKPPVPNDGDGDGDDGEGRGDDPDDCKGDDDDTNTSAGGGDDGDDDGKSVGNGGPDGPDGPDDGEKTKGKPDDETRIGDKEDPETEYKSGDQDRETDQELRKNHGHGDMGVHDGEGIRTNLDPVDPGLEKWARELLSSKKEDHDGKYTVFTKSYDRVYTAYDTEFPVDDCGRVDDTAKCLMQPEGKADYVALRRESGSKLGVMRRKLERALLTQMNVEYEGGFRRGKLNRRALVSAAQHNKNVYRKKQEADAMDTAVTILVDCSGSMGGSKLALAQRSTIALAEALENTEVALEILGFSVNRGIDWREISGLYEIEDADERNKFRSDFYDRYNRYSSTVDTYVFKAFNEDLGKAKRAIGNMQRVPCHNNNDAESIEVAYERLRVSDEKRHVMLVLSDGYPAGGARGEDEYLRDVVNRLEGYGVDMIGIGIQSDAVKQFYPKWVVIQSLDDLSKTVLDQIAKALLGQNFKVDNADLLKAS